ncbi:MAG: 50S ribosome-binding GTPase, partial [Planctomycetia bacterium]|nr:50S ribosome-binding GTPase [Planctomycetia bacterium]
LGVIDATQESRLQAALSQLAGGLSRPLQELRNILWELLEHLEAGFDFADEDILFISSEEIRRRLENAHQRISQLLEKTVSRGKSDHPLRVVLYGPPNIGKSQLFNTLLAEEKSIVYDFPGTTRDYLTALWELKNHRCLLVDTAGDSWERESEFLLRQSQEFARMQQEQADVRLLCWDAQEIPSLPQTWQTEENAFILALRCDLLPQKNRPAIPSLLYVSSQTGEGLEVLKERLVILLQERSGGESDIVASTEIRCRDSLIQTQKSLQNALSLCGTPYEELLASEVRVALEHLGRMVGAIYTEDLLDSIFSRFCIGK